MTTPPTSPDPTDGDGPTSAAAVAAQLSMDPGKPEVLEQLADTVAAVNEWVTAHSSAKPQSRALGATMLAARVYRRRNTPEGVATFTDTGLIGVARSDPEVWMLLGLGSWAPPVVG